MKSILPALLVVLLLGGCAKQVDMQANTSNQQNVILKNPNISVVNVSAVQTASGQVTFKFSTEYEKDLASIELLSGSDETLFCQIYEEQKEGNSIKLKHYTIVDNNAKGPSTFYMIKYTTSTGYWFCSTIYQVSVK